jgi:putative ATPase
MEPLATKLRPTSLDQFIGQEKLLGSEGPLRQLILSGKLPSMIFWGPPGCGKTTIAEIISHELDADFVKISAVIDGKEALKKVIMLAQTNKKYNRSTILFIDEIHRWNKAQQDGLLPYVESGIIVLIGATTENPSFTVISPLLSRCRVFVFESHSKENVIEAINRGLKFLKRKADKDAVEFLAELSNGDLRFVLNSIQIASDLSGKKSITKQDIERTVQRTLKYDKSGEEHYNFCCT